MRVVLYLHILGATVWVGGMIVVAALVPALRKATDDIDVVRAAARRFGTASWAALALQVTTGIILILDRVWTGQLMLKIGLVMVSALLALWHQFIARDQSPAMRGAMEGLLLALGLAIVWIATGL